MRHRPRPGPFTWLAGLLVAYLSVPLIAFVVRLAASNDRGFATPGLWGALRTSVETATISAALVALFGIPLAYGLARARGRPAHVVGILVQLPLALPPVMSGIVLIYLVGPYTTLGRFFGGHLTDSLAGIVLAQTFVSAPFLIIAARSAFAAIDPNLDDLAATLGHRPAARFWRVSLPIAEPGIRAGLMLTWLRAFGEYGATVLLAYHPYSLPVFTYVQFSDTGVPSTQAPTALAIAVAAAVAAAALIRHPRPVRDRTPRAEPRPPTPGPPTVVAFDLHVRVGGFDLRLAHQGTSHRLAILGPSGSGKSVTLRSLAGLLGPHVGQVSYNGEEVAGVPTEDRRIGYIPQGAGLFPHRTVAQQVLFATGADDNVAAWWMDRLGIDDLGERTPEQLSGGQRQRVSMAQALAPHPRVVLLDEPFAALDAPVRQALRRELRRLQDSAGLSTVLVTHDPEEAALLADEVLVIADGRLLQAGPCRDVYRRPATPQVARLLGIANLHHAEVLSPGRIRAGTMTVAADTAGLPAGTAVLWSVRPEQVGVAGPNGSRPGSAAPGVTAPRAATASPGAATYPATVLDVADLGATTAIEVDLHGGPQLSARTSRSLGLAPGGECLVELDPGAVLVWPDPSPAPVR